MKFIIILILFFSSLFSIEDLDKLITEVLNGPTRASNKTQFSIIWTEAVVKEIITMYIEQRSTTSELIMTDPSDVFVGLGIAWSDTCGWPNFYQQYETEALIKWTRNPRIDGNIITLTGETTNKLPVKEEVEHRIFVSYEPRIPAGDTPLTYEVLFNAPTPYFDSPAEFVGGSCQYDTTICNSTYNMVFFKACPICTGRTIEHTIAIKWDDSWVNDKYVFDIRLDVSEIMETFERSGMYTIHLFLWDTATQGHTYAIFTIMV